MKHYPIPAVAEELAVDRRCVKALIRSGELPAVDIAPAGAKYKKWRVSQEALEIFLLRRTATPPTPTTRRRRRRDDSILHFNYD
jgi:hypothetical protein